MWRRILWQWRDGLVLRALTSLNVGLRWFVDVPSGIKGSSLRRLVNFCMPLSSRNWLARISLLVDWSPPPHMFFQVVSFALSLSLV